MLVYSFIVVNKNKIYCNLKDIDMSIAPIEKFIILTEDVALLTKIFMEKKANLVKLIWFVKYFFNVFVADVNLKKNVLQIDMPPSFLLWRIMAKSFSENQFLCESETKTSDFENQTSLLVQEQLTFNRHCKRTVSRISSGIIYDIVNCSRCASFELRFGSFRLQFVGYTNVIIESWFGPRYGYQP